MSLMVALGLSDDDQSDKSNATDSLSLGEESLKTAVDVVLRVLRLGVNLPEHVLAEGWIGTGAAFGGNAVPLSQDRERAFDENYSGASARAGT